MLGELHPDYLLSKLTSRQISEWQAWFNISPYGQDHTDYLLAQLTAMLVNVHATKRTSKAKPTDFMPFYRRPAMSPEQIQDTLRNVLNGNRSNTGRNSWRADSEV